MNYLFRKKKIEDLLKDASNQGENSLKRTLTATSLIMLGVGAIIGAGLFVRTAAAIAQNAGPSVTYAFIIAGIGCGMAGLCYAELSSSIPISGSAYTYTYTTMGELIGWIIGWDLILEYAVGAATVGIAWSEYLNNFLIHILHWKPIAYEWCHSPLQQTKLLVLSGMDINQFSFLSKDLFMSLQQHGELVLTDEIAKTIPQNLQSNIKTLKGIINLPALFIVSLMSLILIKGTKESAFINGIIVIAKVAIVILIITIGYQFINPANHAVYIPEATIYTDSSGMTYQFGGIMGILGAAGTVFFAFIGFDAVSTAAQEAKNPGRDMPIGILGSLFVCTLLYVLFAHVLSGVATINDFRTNGSEASIAYAIQKYMPGYQWLAHSVTIAILAGFSSVILVMLMGQSRVFYSMSKDGLLPKSMSDLHPKFQTPYKANLVILILVGLFAAFVPGDVVGHMTSIGTLFAFILVCLGVILLRRSNPDLPRTFKTPLVPFVPILGIITCSLMIFGLGKENWLRLFIWLALGLLFYFLYGKNNSKLNNK